MSVVLQSTVVGIFEKQEEARRAIERLQQAGFENDQIGYVTRDERRVVRKVDVEAAESSGAMTGGIVGGVLGAANALLIPVLGPPVANTIPVSALPVAEEVVDRVQHKLPETGDGDMPGGIADVDTIEVGSIREGRAGVVKDTGTGWDVRKGEETDGDARSGDEDGAEADMGGIEKGTGEASGDSADEDGDDDDTIEIPRISRSAIADVDTIEMPRLKRASIIEADTMEMPRLAGEAIGGDGPTAGGAGGSEGQAETLQPGEARKREDEATGAVTGGIMGGVLGVVGALLLPIIGPVVAGGTLVAVLGGAALGAVTGTILGSFVNLGVPEERARHYEEEFRAGRTIVTVYTDERQQEVLRILSDKGACYVSAHEAM